jgi:hypothetical protein
VKEFTAALASAINGRCLMLLSWFLLCAGPLRLHAQTAPSGTLPFVLDGNRVYAQVEFTMPTGEPRQALLFVDLGSPSMIVSKDLYEALNLRANKALGLAAGGLSVSVESATVTSDAWFPFWIGGGRKVEGLLPAGILQKYQVRLDYAARTMTLAQPATLRLQGTALPFQLNPNTGLIAIEAKIDGQTYPITVDNGSGYTWIRQSTARQWFFRHPEWRRGRGAVGPGNMRMADDGIETAGVRVRIPEIELGSVQVRQVGALAIARDVHGIDFMDWYSTKTPVPVVGWLGGNVLRQFRITIDYPNKMSYWELQSAPVPDELDYVGLTLRSKDGDYYVAGIADRSGRPAVTGVEAGDKLVQIGVLPTHGATHEAVFAAMHGDPGEIRSLVLERQGRRIQVQTRVTAL